MIVLGKVAEVRSVGGVQIARLRITETLKGAKRRELFFLAQSTWICDISAAKQGETVLLFLFSDVPVPATDDEETLFSLPKTFKRSLGEAGITEMFRIADAGRGRMPVRVMDHQRFVTLWVDDVKLPKDVETFDGAEPKHSFIRSVRLGDILHLVNEAISSR